MIETVAHGKPLIFRGFFKIQTLLGLWIIASSVLFLPLATRAETSPNLNDPPKVTKNWFCELALVKRGSLALKGIRDRFAWGRTGMSEIKRGDFDSYLAIIDQSHSSRGQPIPSVYGPLQGFDADRSARIQQLSAENRNSITPSYFKLNYEADGRKRFDTLENIWYRGKDEVPSTDWKESLARIEGWLKSYSDYQDTLNTTIVQGFEARIQAEALLTLLEGKRAEDFQTTEIIRDGLSFDLPILEWNAATKQVVKSTRKVSFRTYPELTSSYLDAAKLFGETFGLPASPAELVAARRASLKKIAWTQMLNPFFWVFSLPYRMVNDVVGVSTDSFTWLKSKFVAMGVIQGVVDAQAYRRRRLELAHKVISNRRDFQGFPLNAEEEVLLKKLESSLLDPALAPRADAIQREQAKEMRAETLAFYGKRSNLAKLSSSPAGIGASLITSNPTTTAAPQSRLRDRFKPELETNEQLSYFSRIRAMFDRHKKLLVLGAVTSTLTGVIMLQLNNVVAPLTENPTLNYGQAYVSDQMNLLVAKYFDTAGSGNSVIRKQVKNSSKTWDIENPALWTILDAHLSRYRERSRMDKTYNFLADPEFQKDQALVIDKLLKVRKDYAVSALFSSGSEYLLKIGYQKAAIEEMRASYKVQYPEESSKIDVAFNLIATNRYQTVTNLDLKSIRGSSPELYFDLRYFFEKKLPEAVAQVRNFGVMFTSAGDAYQSFGRAPKTYRDEIIAAEKKATEEILEQAAPKVTATKEAKPNTKQNTKTSPTKASSSKIKK
jgi:hypothetical protein